MTITDKDRRRALSILRDRHREEYEEILAVAFGSNREVPGQSSLEGGVRCSCGRELPPDTVNVAVVHDEGDHNHVWVDGRYDHLCS